jgi:hypothetical protein
MVWAPVGRPAQTEAGCVDEKLKDRRATPFLKLHSALPKKTLSAEKARFIALKDA